MNPIEAVTSAFRNFVNFNGRARRSEFWWFALFAFLSQIILSFVPVLGQIYSLVLLLPSLAVTARRLHDTNRTAWWMLLYLVPIVGIIVLAIMFIALLGIYALDPWEVTDAEWGVLGILFLIWLLISFFSWIVLLVFQIMPGTIGPNRYGPDPLRPDPGTYHYGFGMAGQTPDYAPPPPTVGSATLGDPTPSAPPPYSDAGQRRFCTQCGTRYEAAASFCTFCGTPLGP